MCVCVCVCTSFLSFLNSKMKYNSEDTTSQINIKDGLIEKKTETLNVGK